jgi:hypothetical protein
MKTSGAAPTPFINREGLARIAAPWRATGHCPTGLVSLERTHVSVDLNPTVMCLR